MYKKCWFCWQPVWDPTPLWVLCVHSHFLFQCWVSSSPLEDLFNGISVLHKKYYSYPQSHWNGGDMNSVNQCKFALCLYTLFFLQYEVLLTTKVLYHRMTSKERNSFRSILPSNWVEYEHVSVYQILELLLNFSVASRNGWLPSKSVWTKCSHKI